MPVLISVVIPVYRDWERLALCLDALACQTLPASQFEIIVANNEPGSAPAVARLPANARIIDEPRPGSYVARNTAVALSHGEILAFIDSDCIPRSDWLERGLEILAAYPDARVTGPVPIHREPGSGYFAYLYDFHTAFRFDRAVARGRCGAGNLFVSRAVFDRVGPFDPDLASGGDTEWGDRAHRAGVPVLYDARVCVSHPARGTVGAIIRKRRRIAGSEAKRTGYRTLWYVLYKLLPPLNSYSRVVYASARGPVSRRDWVILFFVHWATRIAEAQEFLFVRLGLKRPNRS